MMIDWLTVSQEHDHDLPVVCDVFTLTIDSNTNEVLSTRQPRFKHEASHSTSVTIHVQGRKVRVEGNPSRVGRLDNLLATPQLNSAYLSTTRYCVNTGFLLSHVAHALNCAKAYQALNRVILLPMGPRLNEST
ncbi:hypothetical protein [Pseudomonas syringae]|uniref:hypothetical protein n=1 Tax=Pseudomonas syringae TaxID=317 RepID=UPI00224A7213|nr:hypothetical protein [Pseudomonas syringae]UZS64992.1 hypothetical protein OQB64_12945 [Pseudomonas syringae]